MTSITESTKMDIWKKISETTTIINQSYEYHAEIKDFIINICLNDLNYLKTNFHSITDSKTQYDCLMIACAFCNHTNIIKFLFDGFKQDISFLMSGNHSNSNDCNLLMLACLHNTNLEVIKYLIDHYRMNMTYFDIHGNTYLRLACWKNTNIEVIKYFIDHGMNMNHITDEGNT